MGSLYNRNVQFMEGSELQNGKCIAGKFPLVKCKRNQMRSDKNKGEGSEVKKDKRSDRMGLQN